MTRDDGSDSWEGDGQWQDDSQDGGDDVLVPDDRAVAARLTQLGLSVPLLQGAIREGQAAGDFCTAAHPRFYPGCRVYGETNGGLRLRLGMEGWTFTDDENIPRAVSPDGSVVVTALQGDAQTGLRYGPDAQTRRPRKTGSIRIIQRNAQLLLEDVLPEDDQELLAERLGPILGPTWFLLYRRDGDKVRSELSMAKGVTQAGALLKWSERNILPEIDLSQGPGPERGGGDTPQVDVPIIRRAG
jgi:hypothetical protein